MLKRQSRISKNGSNKRFLINAAVLLGACLLVALRMPSWGAGQIVALVILALLAAFQIFLYFKLK